MAASWEDGRQAWDKLGPWLDWGLPDDVKPEFVINSLREVRTLQELVGRAEYAMVQRARRSNLSWTDIGMALGMTRQSAWERWHQDNEPAESA